MNLLAKLWDTVFGHRHRLKVVDKFWKPQFVRGPVEHDVEVTIHSLYRKYECEFCGGIKQERSGRVSKCECECGEFCIAHFSDVDEWVSTHLDEEHG